MWRVLRKWVWSKRGGRRWRECCKCSTMSFWQQSFAVALRVHRISKVSQCFNVVGVKWLTWLRKFSNQVFYENELRFLNVCENIVGIYFSHDLSILLYSILAILLSPLLIDMSWSELIIIYSSFCTSRTFHLPSEKS